MSCLPHRKMKRHESKNDGGPVYHAYNYGCQCGDTGNGRRNPYPAGRRHDEFERGYRDGSENRYTRYFRSVG